MDPEAGALWMQTGIGRASLGLHKNAMAQQVDRLQHSGVPSMQQSKFQKVTWIPKRQRLPGGGALADVFLPWSVVLTLPGHLK
jgi:hypothetical protein